MVGKTSFLWEIARQPRRLPRETKFCRPCDLTQVSSDCECQQAKPSKRYPWLNCDICGRIDSLLARLHAVCRFCRVLGWIPRCSATPKSPGVAYCRNQPD